MTDEDADILKRLRRALEATYGDRLRRVVLFGSRARGDNRPDSDYDVAVVLDRIANWGEESRRLVDISFDHLGDAAPLISALPMSEESTRLRTPLMHEIRHEGIPIEA